MVVGFGTKAHEPVLLHAGAEKVFTPDALPFIIEHAGMTVRADDTLLVVQPGLLKVEDMRDLYHACDRRLKFQVVGHDPFPLTSDRHFREFRKIKPRGINQTEIVQLTGRPPRIAPTLEQAEAIIRLWHEKPKRPPLEIVGLAKKILGLEDDYDMKTSWVRDLVIKHVGTGQRDRPEGWTGISTETT